MVVPNTFPAVVFTLLAFTGNYFYQGQLPETVQTLVPQVQEWLDQYPKDQSTKDKEGPGQDVGKVIVGRTTDVALDDKMGVIIDKKHCKHIENMDSNNFDETAARIGRKFNLDNDTRDDIMSAKHADSITDAMEHFEHGPEGRYYFGKYTTKKRQGGNIHEPLWNQMEPGGDIR